MQYITSRCKTSFAVLYYLIFSLLYDLLLGLSNRIATNLYRDG